MKLSINTSFINKPEAKEEYRKICGTFENVEVTSEELSTLVKHGYAFCPQLKNNWKKASNFLCSDYLAVDIDEGNRLEDMMEHVFVKKYCSFIYTTVNHTDDHNRFRMVFELEESITNPEQMKHAMSGLLKNFGGDPSCTDPCRMFFGAKGCTIHFFNKTLPVKQVEVLAAHGEESNKPSHFKDTKSSEFTASIVSNNTIDIDMTVIDRDGNNHILKELPPQTPIRCPVHSPDYNASAFTLTSKKGTIGVHCMKCKTTYYTSWGIPPYDFNYSLNNLRYLENATPDFDANVDGFLQRPIPQGITRITNRYLPRCETDSDIVFVRSPKGTGKTYWLEQVVDTCKKENKKRIDWLEDNEEHGIKNINTLREWSKWKGVLLIGHRRSLISSLSERLGLKSYLNHPYFNHAQGRMVKESFNEPEPYYSICVDSLSTLINTHKNWWPIIIIDEVEQVLTHLTSETVKDKRNNTYQVFKHLINSSKKVFLMDADLNELTVETMHQLLFDKNKSVSVVINDHKVDNKLLELYKSEDHLQKDMLHSITNGSRCFVCSNSKRKIDVIAGIIKHKFGDSKKILTITSENSQNQEIQEFLKNIKNEILEYDAILCSPTLGTGIDISFEDNKQHIDSVYGLFETRINTHFDIDQQLSRVRNPKKTRVWISPQTFRFDSNKDVIKKEIEESHNKYRQIVSISPDGEKQYNDDEYLNLYSHVKSIQRGSKNQLLENFTKLKKYNGWKIDEIVADDADTKEIKELKKLSKEKKLINKILNLTTAKLITSYEYSALLFVDNKYTLTDEQYSSMRRYEIEVFYMQEINEKLIELDNDGLLRNQIREYTILKTSDNEIQVMEAREEKQGVLYTDRKSLSHKKNLYINILKKSGLMDDENNFIYDKTIQSSDMGDFIAYIDSKKQSVERLFDISIRADINNKPILQLNTFLKRLGIKLNRTTKKTPDGGKNYLYSINPECINLLEDIFSTRSDTAISEIWHNNREATIENRLFANDKNEHDDFIKDMKETTGKTISEPFTEIAQYIYDEILYQINNQHHDNPE